MINVDCRMCESALYDRRMILAPFASLACDRVTDCVAVGDGTSRKQHTDVWGGIDTSSPRRMTIEHEGRSLHAMCTPKPRVIACAFDELVCLYRVS